MNELLNELFYDIILTKSSKTNSFSSIFSDGSYPNVSLRNPVIIIPLNAKMPNENNGFILFCTKKLITIGDIVDPVLPTVQIIVEANPL